MACQRCEQEPEAETWTGPSGRMALGAVCASLVRAAAITLLPAEDVRAKLAHAAARNAKAEVWQAPNGDRHLVDPHRLADSPAL